jgi:hypothetical protein
MPPEGVTSKDSLYPVDLLTEAIFPVKTKERSHKEAARGELLREP